jgi:RNA polymerase sigma factor (sigma-70 family)
MNRQRPQGRDEVEALVIAARDVSQPLASRHAAFDRLVVRLQDFAVASAYLHLRDTGLAEDAAQESFLAAWRHLHTLKDARVFVAWLKRIVVSRCHRITRRKGPAFTGLMAAEPATADWEALVSRRERDTLVREALAHLPAAERVAVILFYFSGRSYEAIADFLDVPRSTVVKRLFRAKQRLKAALLPIRATLERSRPSRNRAFAAMVRAGLYDDYVGLYRFDLRPELTVNVARVGNRLVSRSAGQKNNAIPGRRLAELRTAEFDGQARFFRNQRGQVTHFIYYEFGKRMGKATKVE